MMVNVRITIGKRITFKQFNTENLFNNYVISKGFTYDNINNYYWKADVRMGWIVKIDVIN